jgi:hypothetical protein
VLDPGAAQQEWISSGRQQKEAVETSTFLAVTGPEELCNLQIANHTDRTELKTDRINLPAP